MLPDSGRSASSFAVQRSEFCVTSRRRGEVRHVIMCGTLEFWVGVGVVLGCWLGVVFQSFSVAFHWLGFAS